MTLIIVVSIILILFSLLWLIMWGWFYKVDKSTLARLQRVAQKAFDKGNYDKAKKLFQKSLRGNNDPSMKYKLALSQLNLKEYKSAQSTLEELLKVSPADEDILMSLAKTLELQKLYDESLDVCTKIVSQNPRNIDCLLNIAKIHLVKKDPQKCLEYLEQIKVLAPDSNKANLLSLQCRASICNVEDEGEYAELISDYLGSSENSELTSDFHFAFAKVYARNGDMLNSMTVCKKAIELNAEDVEAYQLMGLIQLLNNDFDAAKNTLNLALGFEPKNKETHNIFSYVLCQQVDNCPLQVCREKYYKLIEKYMT